MDGPPADFTHLHVRSHYSLLGATPSIPALVERARLDGLRSLALTDANALYGAVDFARTCRAAGIRPIIGMAAALAPLPDDVAPDSFAPAGCVVLLARNAAGYRSLCRLSSLIQASPDRNRRAELGLGWDDLRANREGLFCLTGGRTDWLERHLRAGNATAAQRYLSYLGGIFDEACVVSVSPDALDGAAAGVGAEMIRLASRFGLRAAAIRPIYCLEPGEVWLLRLMAAIGRNRPLAQVGPGDLPAFGEPAGLHWLSPVALAERFEAHPELLSVAAEVATSCGEALPDGRPIWPRLELAGETAGHRLRHDARQGLSARYPDAPDAVGARLESELEAIDHFGFAPLFLVVADIVAYARSRGIPVSTRGSVANSLVAFCLGITTVDPVRHDLLFERFLSPARRSPPDIDLDFCSRRRDEVLDYIRRTYGEDRVALVATFNTFRPRSAVRETAKAHGLDDASTNSLVGLLPSGWHPDPRRRSRETLADVLAKIPDARLRSVVEQAYALVGRPDHLGLHPGGVVITPGPLTDTVPVQWAAKGFLCTQFEHGDVEALGLQKIDCLGIRALTVLADTADLVRAGPSPGFRLEDMPLEDAETARMLAAAETIGVFQCESDGARRTLRQLRARNVADLAVAGAFFKPGPALGGMARAFVRRYRGEEEVDYLHPALEPILGRTKGVLLFQEQVLRLGREIAGLSWEQADQLRSGMSKFKAADMDALADAFIAGCCRPPPEGHALSEAQARTLWEQILPFAGYGFNQGHATAYAEVSYRSAYLKAHWPAEFLCARLAVAGGFHHPAIYMAEAVRLGIGVRPPHVNHSGHRFTLSYEYLDDSRVRRPVLWMGLGQVRDLRHTTVQAIVAERARAPFTSTRDLLARVSLTPKETTHLIQCGALDGLADSRAALLAQAGDIAKAGSGRQLAFGFLSPTTVERETLRQRYRWEQQLLGQPVSVSPLELVDAARGGLRELGRARGRFADLPLFRLPGWTGGPGIFVSDGELFATAQLSAGAKGTKWPSWEVRRVSGHWAEDEWGGAHLNLADAVPVPIVVGTDE